MPIRKEIKWAAIIIEEYRNWLQRIRSSLNIIRATETSDQRLCRKLPTKRSVYNKPAHNCWTTYGKEVGMSTDKIYGKFLWILRKLTIISIAIVYIK